MSRRVARLTLDTLQDLPEPVRGCVFWELDPVRAAQAVSAGEAARAKEEWLSRVLLDWGSCGRVAYVDGQFAGYALFAPPRYLPGAEAFPTAPPGEDAVLLATMFVHPGYAGGGLGRLLMQNVVKDLVKRGGIRALEAFGDAAAPPRAGRDAPAEEVVHPARCVLPADFLLRVGFRTQRNHPRYPRMRLELGSAVTWRAEMEAALERLLGAVRAPRPVAERTAAGPRR